MINIWWGVLGKSRVGKGISARAAHRTVLDSLPSYGSCYPIIFLYQIANGQTISAVRHISLSASLSLLACLLSDICCVSISLITHQRTSIHYLIPFYPPYNNNLTAGAHTSQKHPTNTQTNERRWCRFLNDHPLSFGSLTREIISADTLYKNLLVSQFFVR